MTVEDDRKEAIARQKAVVDHEGGVYVEACPGAGKTRTLVNRVARLTAMAAPRKGIAMLSFTNVAVDEFKTRCQSSGIMERLGFPNFIGTFDGFLNHFLVMPFGVPGCENRPVLVDNWDDVNVTPGIRGVQARPVPLSRFDAATGGIDPSSIRDQRIASVVRQHQKAYEAAAQRRRRALNIKGYLCADDARLVVKQFLADLQRADAIGQALAARFTEIIVDEAQDCNADDVAVLEWLKGHGLKLTLVCDPDQAIFGFRKGTGEAFRKFTAGFPSIGLTGNFRSSANICSAAATMRSRNSADLAVGDHHDVSNPIMLIPYGKKGGAEIGVRFKALAADLDEAEALVLAHKRRLAEQASGTPPTLVGAGRRLARMAQLVVAFHNTASSGKQREAILKAMVRLLMEIEGRPEDDIASLRSLSESPDMDRLYRRRAICVLSTLPVSLDGTSADAWADQARKLVSEVVTVHGGKTIKQALPGGNDWHEALHVLPSAHVPCATIHEAKGRDYDAVCLVLEKESVDAVSAWENRQSDRSEALRVLYVGVTRAKKLLAIAAPDDLIGRVETIFVAANVPYTKVALTAAAPTAPGVPVGKRRAGRSLATS